MTHDVRRHPVDLDEASFLRDVEFRFERRRGPGGQHRNKVETAVVARHRPTGIEAEANRRRSQAENRRAALRQLRLELALRVRIPQRAASFPSPLWERYRTPHGIRVAVSNDDFPRVVAEWFDCWAAHDWRFDRAAEQLRVTTGQMLRFLRRHKRVYQMYERLRRGGT